MNQIVLATLARYNLLSMQCTNCSDQILVHDNVDMKCNCSGFYCRDNPSGELVFFDRVISINDRLIVISILIYYTGQTYCRVSGNIYASEHITFSNFSNDTSTIEEIETITMLM